MRHASLRHARPFAPLASALIILRVVQAIRAWLGLSALIAGLTLLSVTPLAVSALLIAPLFIFLEHGRIGRLFHPSSLTRRQGMPDATATYLRACAADALFVAALVQGSGLCLALALCVPFGPEQLACYLVLTTALLFLHYLFAGCVYLLGRLLLGGLVLPIVAAMIPLCWDLGTRFSSLLVQQNLYVGWQLLEGLLGPDAQLYGVSAVRSVALLVVALAALAISSRLVSPEKVVSRFERFAS